MVEFTCKYLDWGDMMKEAKQKQNIQKVNELLTDAKQTKFTRAQEEIVSQLTVFTRRSFQKGFEGLGSVGVWFG